MTFGQQNTEKEGHASNWISPWTRGELYRYRRALLCPPMAETYGSTEKIIGTWDKLKTQRDKIILATKAMGPMTSGAYARQGARRSSFTAPESTRRAWKTVSAVYKVDYIDLYQLHWPERRVNSFGQRGYQHPTGEEVSLEETLSALKDFQKEGKVRHFGLSNETPWGVMECLRLHREKGLPRMMSIQNPYSLLKPPLLKSDWQK
jgi:aryl-alcohol dehydrogenase-like predicted oxidoreductase